MCSLGPAPVCDFSADASGEMEKGRVLTHSHMFDWCLDVSWLVNCCLDSANKCRVAEEIGHGWSGYVRERFLKRGSKNGLVSEVM